MTDDLEFEQSLLLDLVTSQLESTPGSEPLVQLRNSLAEGSSSSRSAAGEQELIDSAARLRNAIRSQAAVNAAGMQASPTSGSTANFSGDALVDYTYERTISSAKLERRCADVISTFGPITSEVALFSSGMSAVATTLQTLVNEFTEIYGRRPRLVSLSDYFETTMLMELLSPALESWTRATSADELASCRADIVFLEPVRYTWSLDVVAIGQVCDAWSAGAGAPRYVVTDSTLCPLSWPLATILRLATRVDTFDVIDIRSGLKMDQQGLELNNLGIVTVHAAREETTRKLAALLRQARGVLGSGLSLVGILALDTPFVFNREWLNGHVFRVYRNNAEFAMSLTGESGLFRKVSHPIMAPGTAERGVSPFTVLELASDSLASYEQLLGVIRHESARRGLHFSFGASFGFRSHRYETIIPTRSDVRCLLKVAMGSRRGPSSIGITELFHELASLSDMEALRRKFPDARPSHLDF